jgi:hypothetical protein
MWSLSGPMMRQVQVNEPSFRPLIGFGKKTHG